MCLVKETNVFIYNYYRSHLTSFSLQVFVIIFSPKPEWEQFSRFSSTYPCRINNCCDDLDSSSHLLFSKTFFCVLDACSDLSNYNFISHVPCFFFNSLVMSIYVNFFVFLYIYSTITTNIKLN